MDPQVIAQVTAMLQQFPQLIGSATQRATRDLAELAQSVGQASNSLDALNAVLINGTGKYAALAFRLTDVSSSVYGSTQAFTSIIPVIDATRNAFDKVIKFTSSVVGVLPNLISGPAQRTIMLFSAGLDYATNSLKFQIEAAQKVVDAFTQVTNVGGTFAADISGFAGAAHAVELPLQTYSKLVKENAELLTKFGMTFKGNADILFQSTNRIFNSNRNYDRSLVAIYGSYDELNQGVANFYSLLLQTGHVIDQNMIDELDKSNEVRNYLVRQKELTALTGKSAQSLKEAEEKRRTELDYSLKLSRLTNREAAGNVQEGIELIAKIMGPQAAEVAKEYFATGGNIYSKGAMEFAAGNQEALRAIQQVMGQVDQSQGQFRTNVGAYFRDSAGALEAAARAAEPLAEVNRAANNAILTSMTTTSSAILANIGVMQNLEATFSKLKLQGDQIVNKELEKETSAFVNSIKGALDSQKALDAEVIKNMGQLDVITDRFRRLQQLLINMQGEMFRTVFAILSELDAASVPTIQSVTEMAERLARTIARQFGDTPAPSGPADSPPAGTGPRSYAPSPTAPRLAASGSRGDPLFVAQVDPPTGPRPADSGIPGTSNALGGVVNEPTVVGEAGPERLAGDLVFPYDRPVPIQVDWSPLIAAMEENNAAARELVALNEDNLRMQRQLLDAVS